MNHKFRQYLLYALGEMTLVVVGILIALQIDNWNEERQKQDLLGSYLQTISIDLLADLAELKSLRATRVDGMFDATRVGAFIAGRGAWSVSEIYFFNSVITKAQRRHYFKVEKSGYEALKASGVLNQLQGNELGRILSKYYDQVRRIEDLERDNNDQLKTLSLQFLIDWPDSLEPMALVEPRSLPKDRFLSAQPAYAKLIKSPVAREIINAKFNEALVIREYDNLTNLGLEYLQTFSPDTIERVATSHTTSVMAYDPKFPKGYPELVVDGQIAFQAYLVIGYESPGTTVLNYNSLTQTGDALNIKYTGGADWGGIFLIHYEFGEDGRLGLDYSSYDKLQLELKGNTNGETVRVALKDITFPDSEAMPSVSLELTDQWHTYEIALTEFKQTKLEALNVVLGFEFRRDPQSFSVRTARFMQSEQAIVD